jgi:hypothetical protein
MGVLRRRSDFVLLALIALAAQMLLSFGHTHARPTLGPDAPMACRSVVPPSADQSCPPRHNDGKDCSICWSMGTASAAVLGSALKLAVPFDLASSMPALREPLDVPDILTASFQPRGPPASMLI